MWEVFLEDKVRIHVHYSGFGNWESEIKSNTRFGHVGRTETWKQSHGNPQLVDQIFDEHGKWRDCGFSK